MRASLSSPRRLGATLLASVTRAALPLLLAAGVARAQDVFEIQVYEYATVPDLRSSAIAFVPAFGAGIVELAG